MTNIAAMIEIRNRYRRQVVGEIKRALEELGER